MNVLAISTCLPETCVAAEGDKGSFLLAATGGREQAESLLPFMEEAAQGAGFSLKETELVTAAKGPGAFTGLRLGFAAAKAIQLSAACPFIPVPTFEAWAHSLAGCAVPILCVMDAKKRRFYAQAFDCGQALSDVMDISAEEAALEACALLERRSQEGRGISPILALTEPHGRALAADGGFIAAIGRQKAQPHIQFLSVPCGGIFSMISLAKEKMAVYNDAAVDYSIGPLYARKSDAEMS